MTDISWSLKSFKIKELKSFKKNPRRLSDIQYKQLKASLDKFGLIDKPIVTSSGLIIGGHQRVKVLKKENISEIECWVPDRELEAKDLEELNIRLNKNQGEWDFDILANEWNTQDLLEWGFTLEELTGLSLDEDDAPKEEGEVLEPGKDEDAITKSGDIIELERHRLVCGDSTDPETVNKCLDSATPILMVTDPPYGVEYDPSWRGKAGKGQKAAGTVKNDDRVDWMKAWNLFHGDAVYVWHASWFTSKVQQSLEESGFKIISQIIWVKQNFALSRGDYHWQHEPCWYAVKNGCKHNWQGARDQATVWEVASLNAFGKSQEDERTAHSTQKPLDCMLRPIRNNTAQGEGVYDPFLGSGTTLIAAEELNRICYGIEISPAYCDIIVKRWIKYRQKSGKDVMVKRNGAETKDYHD